MNLLLTLVTCHIDILTIINNTSRPISLLACEGTSAIWFVALLYFP
jgi:hypothetical protein